MRDTGFADRSMVPVLLRRIRLRTAVSAARASVEALADLLEQQRESLGSTRPPLLEQGVSLPCGNQDCRLCGAAIDLRERNALREDELLQGIHLIAELLDRIDIGVRHGLFSCLDATEGKPACETAHRLSGGAK